MLFNGPGAFRVGGIECFHEPASRLSQIGSRALLGNGLYEAVKINIAYLFFLYNNVKLTNTQISIIMLIIRHRSYETMMSVSQQ